MIIVHGIELSTFTEKFREIGEGTKFALSNKNEIFMARVKNSNCLKFCTQVEPSKTRKTRKTVYFFFLKYVFIFEKNELFTFTL